METPKGYKLVRDFESLPQTKEEKKVELNKEKDKIKLGKEPKNEELLEYAKATHPYYMEKMKLDSINDEIVKL